MREDDVADNYLSGDWVLEVCQGCWLLVKIRRWSLFNKRWSEAGYRNISNIHSSGGGTYLFILLLRKCGSGAPAFTLVWSVVNLHGSMHASTEKGHPEAKSQYVSDPHRPTEAAGRAHLIIGLYTWMSYRQPDQLIRRSCPSAVLCLDTEWSSASRAGWSLDSCSTPVTNAWVHQPAILAMCIPHILSTSATPHGVRQSTRHLHHQGKPPRPHSASAGAFHSSIALAQINRASLCKIMRTSACLHHATPVIDWTLQQIFQQIYPSAKNLAAISPKWPWSCSVLISGPHI